MNATANTPIVRELTQKRSSRTRSPVILVATDGSETSRGVHGCRAHRR